MLYKLKNGRQIIIPDKELDKIVENLDATLEEAIDLWLDDNNIEINEEADALTAKVKEEYSDTTNYSNPRASVPRKKHASDEKKELFDTILQNLTRCGDVMPADIEVLNENKLISCTINGRKFKIDIIETRQKKKL